MWKFLALLFVLTAAPYVNASEDYGPIPDLFFKEFTSHRYAQSLDVLLGNQGVPYENTQEDSKLRNNFVSSIEALGKYKYKELFFKKEFTSRYVVLMYVVGMEKKPMMFRLNLYKLDDVWYVKSFNFDSDFDKIATDNVKSKM